MKTETSKTPSTIYLKDYAPAPFFAVNISLHFTLLAKKSIVTSNTLYRKNPSSTQHDLVLDGDGQTIIKVLLNEQIFNDYQIIENKLHIAHPPEQFRLSITTELDPANNTALEGLYQSQGNYCTQCEAEGFRRITYFQDRPDVLSIYTVRIEADKAQYPVLLSNGNLSGSGDLAEGRHYTEWHDPFPKPCYLFALVAGNLVHITDQFTTQSGRDVELRVFVRPGDETQCEHAMQSLKKAMHWDEVVYGREYALDVFNIVAVSDFNMGAMENTSLNIFNTALVLAHHETATDSDFMNVEAVVAHEYFHNWTGNRVTCRDWFQLSLKEGLTVFRDQEFSADMNSRAVQRIDDVNALRRMQFSEDASPLAHAVQPENYIEISNFYTTTIYEKGAELIRMQHTLLGAKNYRLATNLYFERHDGQAVTINDFVRCMEHASGRDLSQFFLWYKQAGTPTLKVSSHFDEKRQQYTLTFTQFQTDSAEQTDKQPLHIPIALGLLNEQGIETHATQVLEMTQREQSFCFEGISARPTPSILRGFSAPVKLISDLSDADLRLLQIYDTDGFNKWEAGQTLALRNIERVMQDPQADLSAFLEDIGRLLAQGLSADTDQALLARALSLPEIAVVAQQQSVIDPTAIDKAREIILKQIKRVYKDELIALYQANTEAGVFTLTPRALGKRALRNVLLELLTVSKGKNCAARAQVHYQQANNMTDRVAALACLADSEQVERAEVFEHFYHRYQSYPLVIDKWFKLQAMAKRDSIFNDLTLLRQHADFNLKNPNRVRALYTAFSVYNPVKFHHANGKGYALQRDIIIELNKINPQLAARQVNPFREWKRYVPNLQAQMQVALQAILDTPNLSKDVFEVVSKSLQS